jgi:hypothetical protein
MALQLTSASVPLAILTDSITYEEKIDDPVTSTFTVPDSVAYSLSQYQVIQVTDTVTSTTLFTGYIDNVADTALIGNLGIRMRVVTCKGNRWTADKLTWTGPEFNGWMAGDVAAELHRVALAAEGVTAQYALRHDMDIASWGAGTLTNTTGASGALTLSSAGMDFTKTESVTADFATGTLTNTVAISNALKLTSYLAIKYTASVGANLDNNDLYSYTKVWAGTAYPLVSQDEIYCDIWIDSRSPEIKASIELLFSDGTWMHDASTNYQDQETIRMEPNVDLKGWADDQWYTRKCIVPAAEAGKSVVAIYIAFQGEKGGDYTAYFKNIKITNSGASIVRRSVFSGTDTTMATNVRGSVAGYYNVKASVVTVYAESGSRVSPARSLTGVGIARGSVISWVEGDTAQPTGATNTYPPQVLIEASIDGGASWATCTNHGVLPDLIPGMNTSGVNMTLRQTLSIGGPNPELAPILDTCSFTVYSAAAATKTDFSDIDNTSALLGGGTLTNATSYADGVKTTGQYRNFDDLSVASQTLFGTGAPTQGVQTGYYFTRGDSGTEVQSRFDFAGNWQNFIAELDIQIVTSTGNYGFQYRTTSYLAGSHRYAYVAFVSSSQLILSRGSNGGADAFTQIATVSLNLPVGNWYRMKVVVNGSSHKIFINDFQFISVTDATYSATANVGVWSWDNAVGRQSGHFDNFGIIGYESDFISVSSRTTAALALSGIVGDSRINWTENTPSTSTFLVERTLDNGVTWAACTNGAQIPSLVSGYNAAGISVKFRFSMTNQSINLPAALQGFSAFIIGQYSASGTRVSPVLALDNAGTIGSSALTWNAATPAGTGVVAATSPDNITYTTIAASGNPIAGLLAQGPMVADDFDVNSAANYTGAFWAGGVTPAFTIDTANSRMQVTSGTNAIVLWNTAQFPIAKDVYLELITDQCDVGGLVFRYIDVNNLYYVTYRDNSAGTNPNTVAIRKRVTSTDTQLIAPTALPATFLRGTYHTLKVTMVGSTITAYFDGVQAATASDVSLTAAGQVGIRQNSATTSDWYSLRAQALGDSATGKNIYSKLTLSSTDPTQNPVVSNLVTSVRGPDLMTGVMINSTDYAYKKQVSGVAADIASQSKMYWRIDKNKKYIMKDRAYSTAPWPLYSADPLFKGSDASPLLTRQSPLYRNRQYVYNAIDLQTIPESKLGDGTAQSWVLKYPVDSITSLTLDGNPQTFGVQGVDTGKSFYYQPGQPTLSQDSAQTPPTPVQIIAITYVARVPYVSMRENTAQQAALAPIDSTSGIVSASEDGGGISKAAADTLAQARIDAYAILGVSDWEYVTERSGLAPGMLQTMFVPEHGLFDTDMLITDIITTLWLDGNSNLNYRYDVKATSGPNIGTAWRVFAQL